VRGLVLAVALGLTGFASGCKVKRAYLVPYQGNPYRSQAVSCVRMCESEHAWEQFDCLKHCPGAHTRTGECSPEAEDERGYCVDRREVSIVKTVVLGAALAAAIVFGILIW